MNIMKKLVLLFAVVAGVSQSAFSQISIDPEVGMNMSNIRSKVDDKDAETTDSKMGFSAGVGVKFDIANGLYVKPGAYYHLLGGESEVLGSTVTTDLHYVRIPVNVGYSYNFSPKAGSIFVEAGPYVGMAVAGQTKAELAGIETKNDIEFGDGLNEMKAFDWGFNFGLGYETPWGVYVKGGYGLGLGNMSNIEALTTTNQHWNVAIGYSIKL